MRNNSSDTILKRLDDIAESLEKLVWLMWAMSRRENAELWAQSKDRSYKEMEQLEARLRELEAERLSKGRDKDGSTRS